MEFQFVIPSSNNDLLETDKNNYFVKRVFNCNEIPDLLKGACFNIVYNKINNNPVDILIIINSKKNK